MAHSFDGRRWRRIGALLAGLCIVALVSGCKKPAETETEPEATPAPATPTPAKVAAVTPAPTPAPAAPATPKPELAPPGIYFLVTAVSVETSDGILGLKPGQMLKEIKPGLYQADTNQVSLRPDQVTNDLAIARRVAVRDQATQTALRARLGAAPVVTPAAGGRPGTTGPAAQVAAQNDAKMAARKELMQQLDDNMQASQRLSTALSDASAHWGGNWDVAAKKSSQVYQLLQQYKALQQERVDISAKLSSM